MPKSNYIQGTINLTKGSPIVVGSGTKWLTRVFTNDILMVDVLSEGQVVSTLYYRVKSVISDTELTLNNNYEGETVYGSPYIIQRYADMIRISEMTIRQMEILDSVGSLEIFVDQAEQYSIEAQTASNAAKQYSAEAENSMNSAISAATKAELLKDEVTQYRDEAKQSAQTATQQATVSTEQATVSTTQANIAIETVNKFLNNANSAGGAVIIGEDGKISIDLLPNSVQDVKSYPSISDFPATGETGFIYLAIDTQKVYLWATNPANSYVPIDTQLSLAGTGSAQTAARSDHTHDGIYEPAHTDYVWSGVVDTNINLDTMFIKDGNYLVTSGIQVNIEGTLYYVNALFLKSVGLEAYWVQKQTIMCSIDNDINNSFYATRFLGYVLTGESLTPSIQLAPAWKFAFASDSLRLGGSKYNFVSQDEYNTGISNGSISSEDVSFIEETTEDFKFAVKSVNNVFPDGTGNVSLQLSGQNTILANPDQHPLFRNANNISTDGQVVQVTVVNYGTVENFPNMTNANTYVIEVKATSISVLQTCTVLLNDGNIELYKRFKVADWQEWKQI